MEIRLDEDDDILKNSSQIRDYRRIYQAPAVNWNTELSSPFSFKWTRTEYTPKQLVDNFQQYMPFIVMTTVGYLGRDENINSVSSDEVYWLKGVLKLSRVVVVNEDGAYFSIPVNVGSPVVALRNHIKVGNPTSVKHVITEDRFETFRFIDEGHHDVYVDAGTGESAKFGELRIVDRYEERYLLVHALCSETLSLEAGVIPVYIPTRFVIAVGMDTHEHHHFYEAMLAMHQFIRSIPKTVSFPLFLQDYDDIMVFETKPKEREYEMLLPIRYLTLSRVRKETQQKHKARPSPECPSMSFEKQYLDQSVSVKSPTDKESGTAKYNANTLAMVHCGYTLVEVETKEALCELQQVLKTGLIPRISSLKMTVCKVEENQVKKSKTNPASERAKASSRSFSVSYSTSESVSSQQIGVKPGFVEELKRTVAPRRDEFNIYQPLTAVSTSDQCTTSSPSNVDKNKEPPKESGITSFDDIPKDITNLNCEEVGQCLTLLHLSKYKETFEDQQIDGHLLVDLDADLLQSILGFNRFEAIKLMKFINGWRPVIQSSANESPV